MEPVRIERRVRPCRECIYFLFVLSFIMGGAVLRQMNLLIVMAGLMIGMLIINWRFVVAMLERLTFERLLPERVGAGDQFTAEVIVRNNRQRLDCWALVVEDDIHREGSTAGQNETQVQVLLSHLSAGSARGLSYRCRFAQRGRYVFGPLSISTRFPLGLVRASQKVEQTDSVVVYPRMGQLRPAWNNRVRTETQSQQASIARGRLDGDYFGLRDWRSGDNQRWVHWRATAKLGSLTVCEYEQHRSQQLALLVDLWLPPNADQQHRQLVETAVSFSATAIADVCRGGSQRIALGIAGNTHQYACAPTSIPLLNDSLELLATIQGDNTNEAIGELLPKILRDTGASTRMLVISTRAMQVDQLVQMVAASSGADVRSKLNQLSWIDVGSPDLPRWFEADPQSAGVLV